MKDHTEFIKNQNFAINDQIYIDENRKFIETQVMFLMKSKVTFLF